MLKSTELGRMLWKGLRKDSRKFQDGVDIPGEEGNHFEKAAFGDVVTESNMNAERKSNTNTTSSMYTIKKGDTLGKIAKANGTSVGKLQKLNGIKDANKINSGDNIKLK